MVHELFICVCMCVCSNDCGHVVCSGMCGMVQM